MKKLVTLSVSLFLLTGSYVGAQNYFPQTKVNKAYFLELNRLLNGNKNKFQVASDKKNLFYHTLNTADLKRSQTIPFLTSKGDIIVGNHDTLLIDADTSIYSNIFICNNGAVIVDDAELILAGFIYAIDSGCFILRNNAYLKFPQFFINQYGLHLLDHAVFDAENSTIDGNGVPVNEIELYDSSIYIARNVDFNDWSFRKLFDHSSLILEYVDYVGDMLVRDSCHVEISHCTLLLPWLEIPENSVISMSFPNINPFVITDTVFHFEFNESVANVDGIGYSITIDTCNEVIWGMDVQPGSNLTVSNSKIFGFGHRFMHSDTMNITGIRDSSYYLYLNVPFYDRVCHLINTSVYSWQLYGQADSAVVNVDSCSFGELMAKENCEVYASNSICDGIWIHLGTNGNSFLSFSNCLDKSFADTWNRSTMLLTNSEVRRTSGWAPAPLGPNYAHHHSYFLSVNSAYDYIPYALDTSLVMFLFLNTPEVIDTDTISILPVEGSAWLQAGTESNVTFTKYKLYYSAIDSISWIEIGVYTDTVTWGILGYWDISALSAGDYIIKMSLFDSNNDSLSALGRITLTMATSAGNEQQQKLQDISIYPNPASDVLIIENKSGSFLQGDYFELFDSQGKKIYSEPINKRSSAILYLRNYQSGQYFVKVYSGNNIITKKIEILK